MLYLTLLLSCSDPPVVPEASCTGHADSDPASDGGDGGDGSGGDGSGGDGGDTDPPVASALDFDGARPKNVLMISLDTTRPDRLGGRGGSASTPRLDALLAGGVTMEDHRSCSNWTFASVLCVQAGARGLELGFVPTTSNNEKAPGELVLASELLTDAGWRASLVTANIWFSPENGMDQGFATVDYVKDERATWVADNTLVRLADAHAAFTDDGNPWYVHAHFLDPHSPYDPPGEYRDGLDALDPLPYDLDVYSGHNAMADDYGAMSPDEQALVNEHVRIRYDGELAYADAEIGRLLDEAAAMGALDDTLVVFWTDHGEAFWEHGDLGHRYGLFEQENRAIASFSAPGLQPARWAGPTVHSDIWPTVFSALELDIEAPWFTGRPAGARSESSPRCAIRHSGDPTFQFAERDGAKLYYWWSGEKALYRLEQDPSEALNAYDPEDPEVIALWEILLPEVERLQAIHPDWEPTNPGP